MGITVAHGGDIEYIPEGAFNYGLPASGTLHIPSDSVLSIELQIVPNTERHYTVSSHQVVDTSYHGRDYVLNLEYKLQQRDTAGTYAFEKSLEYYALYRASTDLQSLCFFYTTNGTYYELRGCKVNTMGITCNLNETLKVSMEIWPTSIVIGSATTDFGNYASLIPSPSIGNVFEVYGGAALTRSGKWVNGIKTASFNFNNALERVPIIGTYEYTAVFPGPLESKISCEILTDTGGWTDVNDLINKNETDIVFDTGTTTSASQKFTFTKPTYDRMPLIYRADMSHMVIAADLGTESLTHAKYA